MKCAIIRDLLPSYIDKLTSEESNREIEKHLETCSDCQSCYDSMTEDIDKILPQAYPDDVKLFIRAKWYIMRNYLKFILIISVMALILNWEVTIFDPGKFEVYELSNGDIFVENWPSGNYPHSEAVWDEETYLMVKEKEPNQHEFDKNFYYTGSLWQTLKGWPEIWDGAYYIAERAYFNEFCEEGDAISRVTYGKKGWPGYQVIWEAGDRVKKAPADIEERAQSYYQSQAEERAERAKEKNR